jgi:hypothetical protein
MLVYGIDFSQQIYEIYVDNKRTISRLEKEQEITNNLLGTMVTCETMLMEREYLQEIPPKN